MCIDQFCFFIPFYLSARIDKNIKAIVNNLMRPFSKTETRHSLLDSHCDKIEEKLVMNTAEKKSQP
jgi:hypothetical protein